ncbi:MAG: HAD family phosphatase [Thermoplasmata archaeon]|nr:HAD family phosphatase [Thermoplasmata archaeon]
MARPSLLLWDVGGVLLTNGWDRAGRAAAAERFHLDAAEFERRHLAVDAAFETGRMDASSYLATTVFHTPRAFSPEEFLRFMESRSAPVATTLELAKRLRESGKYTMAALNNESRELNEYRIVTFGLRDLFHVFLSSCYTGRRKPDPDAFRYALTITQRSPEESVFLDDRPENVAAASSLGLRTVLVTDAARLGHELEGLGVTAG